MSGDVQEAARALRDAAHGLLEALQEGDDEAIDAAYAQRNAAFEVLAGLEHSAEVGAARSLVREAAALDASAVEVARKRLEAIRVELGEVRRARAVARALQATETPARFVSKRV